MKSPNQNVKHQPQNVYAQIFNLQNDLQFIIVLKE
jgi:hypothetical protein